MTPQKVHARVLIGEVFPLDFKLGASAIQLEAVTVAAAAGVEMRTSEIATNVTQQQIERLPTASRNFLDLAALAPGVTISDDRINSVSRNFSAGGQTASTVNVFVDGTSLKNDLTNGGVAGEDQSKGNPFPRSAIQEYRVISQNFKAEYQKASSAIITATTKSGGNEWHGNVLYGYQNKDLVALDTFQIKAKNANPLTFTKPDYSRSLVSLSLGGPIQRDRLFFFGAYEGNYQNRNFFVNFPTPRAGFPALEGAARSRVPARLRGRPRRRVPLASGTTGPFLPRFCRINGSTISPQSTQTNASNVYPLLSRRSMAQSHPPHRWHFMSLTHPERSNTDVIG